MPPLIPSFVTRGLIVYDNLMISIIAILIASSIPLLFLFIVYKLDLYKTGNFQNIVVGFVGGIGAYFLAYFANTTMRRYGLVDTNTMVRFSGPFLEEIFKGLILLYLIRKPSFTYFVDGAIYGFAAGIGFAIFENFEYILGSPSTAMGLAIGRVLSTNLVHATGSGLIGISLGIARFDRSSRRIVVSLLGLGLAVALHMTFNNMVTRLNSDLILLYAAAIGFGGALVIGLAIRRGLKEEKTWIMETLGDADRVTAQEKSAVEGLDKLHKLLAPLAARFGPKKAAQVEKFLAVQARLGILRKTMEKHPDQKMQQAIEVQIQSLSAEMDQARREVGSYCMLYLRNTFLEETGTLYQNLENLLKERSEMDGQQGGGKAWMQAFGSKLEQQNPKN